MPLGAHFSAEDKIWIVLDGLRGEDSIAELCRKEGIAQSQPKRLGVQVETHVSQGLGHSIDPAGLRLGQDFVVDAFKSGPRARR